MRFLQGCCVPAPSVKWRGGATTSSLNEVDAWQVVIPWRSTHAALSLSVCVPSPRKAALLGLELATSGGSLRLRDVALGYPTTSPTVVGLLSLVATALRAAPGLSLHFGLEDAARDAWRNAAAGLAPLLQERVHVVSCHLWSVMAEEFVQSVFPPASLADVLSSGVAAATPGP